MEAGAESFKNGSGGKFFKRGMTLRAVRRLARATNARDASRRKSTEGSESHPSLDFYFFTESSSTSKTSVEPGPMSVPIPWSP